MSDDLIARLRTWEGDSATVDEAADRIAALEAELAAANARADAAETERDEALRRRDAWKAKAEGFDAVRLALREKVGAPWPPHLSRILWAGIAADEKARADAAEEEARFCHKLLDHAKARVDAAEAQAKTAREDALREAARVARDWWFQTGRETPHELILALIPEPHR